MENETGGSLPGEGKMERVIEPAEQFKNNAVLNDERLYNFAWDDSLKYWEQMAGELEWYKKWDKVLDTENAPYFRWFDGGRLNVSYNCLDRHVNSPRRNKAALIFESEKGDSTTLTYYQLFRKVNLFANVLKRLKIGKGSRVVIYMPMIPEAVIAMLACVRVGAVHSVVFSGFSAGALETRLNDLQASLLITVDEAYRKGKYIPLMENARSAFDSCECVERIMLLKRGSRELELNKKRELWYHELEREVHLYCQPEEMEAEDPLFILYSSGTTGKPKGILHTSGGYLVGVYTTFKYVFDCREEDIFWSTSDIGWITGQSYIVYGPLANGATSLLFEGTPDYPQKDRFWQIIEKHGVTIFYTAPTAISTFMRWGKEWVEKRDLSTLRLLGTVGEPIKPVAWYWYYRNIGKESCPIVDTWWQTETGMIMISTLPGVDKMKPGSAGRAFPGIQVEVVDEDGTAMPAGEDGYLVIPVPWPAMLRNLFYDPERYESTYWQKFPGMFFTGDGARKDDDGYIRISGRVDDVINVSGHRLGTAEIEGDLVEHQAVAEAAAIGKGHEIKGQAVSAFVTLKEGFEGSEELAEELKKHIVHKIGPIARPDDIFFAIELPKTRSGKIMRRLLRDIAEGRALGDTSTLINPEEVEGLKEYYAEEDQGKGEKHKK